MASFLRRAGTALISIFLIASLYGSAKAQTDFAVVEVEVVGNRVATSSLILGVSSIAKGSPLSPTIVQNTLQRLYGLGIFKDIKLEAVEISGGLKVFIIVTEFVITRKEYKGEERNCK